MPARTWPCRAAYSNASGFSGSVTGTTVVEMCSGKASIGSMTDGKCQSTSRFYTFQIGCRWSYLEPTLLTSEKWDGWRGGEWHTCLSRQSDDDIAF
ncbi:uncharacterized protein TNCV_1499501 [Trichonephila clavipes]|nr:uncharacterized protein TNCV_1499501 [Trichonephila clavipes]